MNSCIDLTETAQVLMRRIVSSLTSGVPASDVVVHPEMKKVMDQVAGYPLMRMAGHLIVTSENCPKDGYMLRKAPTFRFWEQGAFHTGRIR